MNGITWSHGLVRNCVQPANGTRSPNPRQRSAEGHIFTGKYRCSADMGSKQTRSNTHEHRVLVDTDLQRVTWKEEASNPKPQTSLCPDTKAGNFEGMRRSSPTHATGARAHPHLLFLELPSQLYWIINAFPVCSCSQLWDFHSFPSYSYPFLPPSFPSSPSLFLHLFIFATLS
jgi:hypothetical protein